MRYDPAIHRALRDYLQAVEEVLSQADVPAASREEIRQNVISQFEDALIGDPGLSDEAYVATLDDPERYAEGWGREESDAVPAGSGAPVAKPVSILRAGCFVAVFLAALIAIGMGMGVFSLLRLRNEIVTVESSIKSSWAQIETNLQRRYDLIPNLVETVKGYATHEKEVFEEVARLRSQWAAAQSADQQRALMPQMEGALSRVIAISEQYPTLKASDQFLALQYQLEGSENRIAVARTRYNDVLREYNALVRRFPANLLGYPVNEEFFEAAAEAKAAPKVKFP